MEQDLGILNRGGDTVGPDFMGFYGDFMGFYGDVMSRVFYCDLMGFYCDFMGFLG